MKYITILVATVLASGCHAIPEPVMPPVPAGQVVVVMPFKGNCDPAVAQSIQDAFVSVMFNYTNAKVVKRDTANAGEIAIFGLVTTDDASSDTSRAGIIGSASGVIGGRASGKSATGSVVTGITVQVYRDQILIATGERGQDIAGGSIMSPLSLARPVAIGIMRNLVRIRAVGQKGPE